MWLLSCIISRETRAKYVAASRLPSDLRRWLVWLRTFVIWFLTWRRKTPQLPWCVVVASELAGCGNLFDAGCVLVRSTCS